MSPTAEVVMPKARRLKTQASYSGVVAFLFSGGAASTIIWSANGLAPSVAATGITLSLLGTAIFGIIAPLAYQRYKRIRELNTIRHDVAGVLSKFPERSDFELTMASAKARDVWARLEHRLAGGIEVPEEHFLKLYEVLERVNGAAHIRFSEASQAIETATSWEKAQQVCREFQDSKALTERVQDRYRIVLLTYLEGKRLDVSLYGMRWAAKQLAISASEQVLLSKTIIERLRKDETITEEHYYRLFASLSQLEPLMKGFLVSPSQRQQAVLDYQLVQLEIVAYTSDRVLKSLDIEWTRS